MAKSEQHARTVQTLRQYRDIFEHTDQALVIGSRDGKTLELVNNAFAAMHGYTVEELTGAPIAQLFRPEDWPRQFAASQTANERGRFVWETQQVRKDGTLIPVEVDATAVRDASGDVLYRITHVTDLTERKRAEEALRHSEERYRALLDAASQIVWTNDPKGEMYGEQPGWEEFTGQTYAQYQGYGWAKAVHPDDAQPTIDAWKQAVASHAVFVFEHRLRRWDGVYRTFSIRAVPVLEQDGSTREWVGVHTDVTEQREAERQVAEFTARQQRIAGDLQRSLLLVPPPDTFPGITVKPLYHAASEDTLVGGDFYDLFAVSEDRVALVIGDVTGKGLEAATYTAEVKFALRAFLREHTDPAVALGCLNQFVRDTMRFDTAHLGGSYVVASVAVIDTRNGQMHCSVAGMEPPFILRANGDVSMITAGGLILGAVQGAEYTMQGERLESDDLFVMSTDGITEARDGSRFFGYKGLHEAVREAAHLRSLSDIGQSVARKAREFARGRQQDDVCLILARRY